MFDKNGLIRLLRYEYLRKNRHNNEEQIISHRSVVFDGVLHLKKKREKERKFYVRIIIIKKKRNTILNTKWASRQQNVVWILQRTDIKNSIQSLVGRGNMI